MILEKPSERRLEYLKQKSAPPTHPKALIPQLYFTLILTKESILLHKLAQQANIHVPSAKALILPQLVMFSPLARLLKNLPWERICVSII